LLHLSNRCNSWGQWGAVNIHYSGWSSLGLWAVAGDVTGLTALIAGLASSVERSTIWSGAVTADVAELAACEALQGLSLAVSGEMVALTALVAGCWAWALESSTWSKASLESATRSESTTSNSWWCSAVAGEMALETTGVAAAGGSGKAEGWAVGLDVSNAGARIALLGLGGAWERAAVRFVSWLLAVIAKALSGRALVCGMSDLATFVAGTAR